MHPVERVEINRLQEKGAKKEKETIRFINLIKKILFQIKTQWSKAPCSSWRNSK